jgi:hypothetical protein
LGLLDLLLHRVEGFRVGSIHLLSVGLSGSEHLIEIGEDLVKAGRDTVGSVGLAGDETNELVEFCEGIRS